VVKEVERTLEHRPDMEAFVLIEPQVLLRFHRWADVLQMPEPPEKRLLSRTFRHFARAMALASQRRQDEAGKEQQEFEALRQKVKAEAPFGFNGAGPVLGVAASLLRARLAHGEEEAVKHYRLAVGLEDALRYGEPPDWYYPVRESLGAALLRAGKAAEAEAVFRDDLKKHRRNARSLFGLKKALEAQKKTRQAELVEL